MKVLVYGLLVLLHVVKARRPPAIEVDGHSVQEHGSIGRFVELSEHSSIMLRCSGREGEIKYGFPDMKEHANYDQRNFNDRVEEYIDDEGFGDTILTINDVRESDTGTYTCMYLDHESINDTIHIFVHGSSIFVPLNTVALELPKGDIVVPCKTTKFIEKSDIELYTNEQLIKSASKHYDLRYGFKLSKKALEHKSLDSDPFTCQYKKDPKQELTILISEKDEDDEESYKFYWKKEMDWPYVGLNFTMTCHLDFEGPPGSKFHPYLNKLRGECPQCSSDYGSHAFVNYNRVERNSIILTIRVDSLELEDEGKYRCIWSQEGKENQYIDEEIHVAPRMAQIKVVNQSTPILSVKEGESFSLAAKFAIYPTNGESYIAKWRRMYNSSIKDGIQDETIGNNDFYSLSSTRSAVNSEKLEIGGAAVTANMSGTYILSISHLGTEQSVKWEVAVESKQPDVQIVVRAPSSPIVFIQKFYRPDTHLHIDCVAISIPPADVVFERKMKGEDFTRIDPNDLTRVAGTFENGFIWNVSVTDDMEVRCTSEQNGQVVSKTQSIIVADEVPQTHIEIIKNSQATDTESVKEIYEGDKVKLTCVVPNGANWEVFWRFGRMLMDSDTVIDGHSKKVILLLRDVTVHSSGEYTCVVKSRDSDNEQSITGRRVMVQKTSRPYHTNADSMTAVVVEYDKTFSMDCNMAGVPAPKYLWYKDGREYLHGDFNGSVMTIHRARAEDDGEFHCLATNRAGSTDNKIRVQVKGAPKSSSFFYWVLFLAVLISAGALGVMYVKLRDSKKIAKQKDIALCELYESLVKNQPGPPPENMKQLPINERVYYLAYDNEFEIAKENLEIGNKLGTGNFGIVYHGLLSMADPKSQIEYKSRLPVAVKSSANPYDISQQRMIAEELKVMCAIGRHPNILALVGAVTNNMRKGQLYIVTEYVECGDLRNYLQAHKANFKNELVVDDDTESEGSYLVPNSVKKKKYSFAHAAGEAENLLSKSDDSLCTSDLISYALQIANGMEYLASVPFVHRDLATRNILLTKTKIIRIADFGLAKQHNKKLYYQTQKSKEQPIPVRWMPAEAIDDQKFTESSDVWSFGICLYEIFTLGGLPYPDIALDQVTNHIRKGDICRQPEFCHDEIYELMKLTWMKNPKDRPSFGACVHYLKQHMELCAPELLAHVDNMLRIETEHQAKLDDWIRKDRPENGANFKKPVRKPVEKPTEERYLIVESHA